MVKSLDTTLQNKVKKSIERLKAFEPEDGYYLAYSGGKDSDCIKILANLANVKYEAVHHLITVDAPETVQYVKSQKDVRIEKPKYKDGSQITMWNLIVKIGMPPLRTMRYCCEKLKENSGDGKLVITGVRWAESPKRKQNGGVVKFIGKPKGTQKLAEQMNVDYKIGNLNGVILNDDNDESRRMVELCYRTRKTMVNPIIDWTDNDVWEFLNYYNCKSNPLYECGGGYKRIGCIGCPMASDTARKEHFNRYPIYKENYTRAFDKMIEERKKNGKDVKENWATGEDVFNWWVK